MSLLLTRFLFMDARMGISMDKMVAKNAFQHVLTVLAMASMKTFVTVAGMVSNSMKKVQDVCLVNLENCFARIVIKMSTMLDI